MNLHSFLQLSLLLWSAAVFSTCQKDTCNAEVTFLQMEAALRVSAPDSVAIDLHWENAASLPEAYFQKIFLITGAKDYYGKPWVNDFALVDRIQVTSDTTATIVWAAGTVLPTQRPLELHLQFPDRRGYLACEHPGSADAYYLDIQMKLDNASGNLALEKFSWKELLIKGGY